MLRISKLADYASLIMCKIAASELPAMSATDIAAKTDINLPTVRKILKQLLAAGLLSSERGAVGGYHLSKSIGDISVANIVEAIDGPLALTDCAHPTRACAFHKGCQIKDNWQVINVEVKKALMAVSLAQLAKRGG